MKNIFNIFLTDLNNIRKKRAAIVVVVALMILPSMYAWFNILPSWDPYSNTAGVNVAVVSIDEGAEAEGKSFNVGDEIIKSLQENDKLGWQFVNEEEAMKGVEKGDYYATIIIPTDFSEKLASVLSEKPQKPVLDYYINEKINAIAPKVTNAGASGIVESIQSGFVKVTNEVIFTVFNDIGIELETNRGEIERFRDTVYELEGELPEIERMIGVANTDMVTVEKAIVRVNEGMVRAEELSKEAEVTSKRIEEMLTNGNNSVQKYVPIVIKDLRLSQQVIKQVPDAVNRVHEKGGDIDEFLDKLVDGTEKIDTGVEALEQLADLIDQLDKSLTEDRKLEGFNDVIKEELDRLTNLKDKVNNTIQKLESGDNVAVDIITEINNEITDMQAKLNNITCVYEDVILEELKKQLEFYEEYNEKLTNLIVEIQPILNNFKEKVEGWISEEQGPIPVEDQEQFLLEMKKELESKQRQLEIIIKGLEASSNDEQDLKNEAMIIALKAMQAQLDNILKEIDENLAQFEQCGAGTETECEDLLKDFWPELLEKIESTNEKLDYVAEKQIELNKIIDELIELNDEIKGQLDQLRRTIDILKDITDQMVEHVNNPVKLLSLLKDTVVQIEQAEQILQSLIDFNEMLQEHFDDGFLLEGKQRVEEMRDDLLKLKATILRVSAEAKDGKEKVSAGLEDVKKLSYDIDEAITELLYYINYDLMPKYADAFNKANRAINEGNRLLAKANDSFPVLQDMLTKVDGGLGKGKDGLAKATEVFPDAQAKINDIASKIRNLEEQGDLDKIIKLMKNDPNAESDFLADPIFLEEHELFPIPNYGSAMAPFFTAMSLWVGGLILVSSLIVDVPNKHKYKSYEAYFGRFILFWLLGLMQAFIVTMGNMYLLKTYVAHKVMYVLFAFIISTAFVIIIYTFVSVFGNTGKVISIILLVMQLGASGGTFPIQMTPDFFQKIHAFLPFTHALGLFREAVGGIIWPVVLKHIAWLAGYGAIFLFIGIKLKETINKRSDKFLEEARESGVIL